MKKLMTSVIILLPLLILAILLVSGAILSLVTHIYVESVEFVGNGALVLTMEDETAPPTKQLEVNVLPLKAENRGLVYTVENENIATVDENGVVTAKFYGETYVTVTSTENKAAFAKRAVVVTDVSVHKLVLNEDRKSDLYEGETQELSVTVYPKEATNKSVIWSSSDESILHVEPNGTVTAVGAGDATVTAVSEDNPEVRVDTVIRCHKKLLDLEFDQTIVVTALKESEFPSVKTVPADADVTFTYKSDDPAVATVDGNGRITFHKEGHAVITVTATDFGGNTVEKQKEYTSTDGYFLPPLFAQKEFTVDYDEYKNGEPLPIPFADSLEDSYREFVRAKYTVENVLEFDKDTKSFRFANPMPVGGKTIKAEITALVYSAEQAAPVEYEDYFFLTVLRNAEKISVSYLETADAAAITIAEKTLTLSANGGSEGTARVRVSPENHTDELSYSLVSGNDVAELSAAGVLSFRRAGEVTVKILCSAEDTVTAEKTVRVIYAPAEAGEQKVIVSNGQTEDGTLVLTMASETDRQTGILYYTEPEGATVEYTAEADGGTVAEIKTENGARRIVPLCGGFATVKIAVTSENSAAQTYSVRVYVDCPVTADDLTVVLGGKPCADKYGTAEKSVEYLFSVLENNASMAGKKLYVSYQGEKFEAEEGSPSHAGTIAFDAELSTLPVTFGVEYGEHAAELGAAGALPTVTRTLMRNAESLSFSYKGTPVRAITTTVTSLTFTAAADAAADKVNMTIAPANHTETVEYSLSAGQNDAKITADGVLTFHDGSKACSVTVQVRLRGADGEISLTKEITVNYAPRNEQDKVVVLPEGDMTDLLLRMDEAGKADKAKIDFIEPEGATVICRASGNVVKVEKVDYEWTILPLKGGFDTVTVTVSGQKEQTYTVNVYVDRTVKDNFTVKLNNTEYAVDAVFATTQTSIPFEVTVNCDEDAMAGKQIYVKYGGTIRATGAEGQNTFSDTIQFPKGSGDLVVEFGVQYAETAAAYGPTGKLPAALRNFARNAESITFSYNGTEVTEVTTTSTSLTFTTDTVPAANRVNMAIAPASHTDTAEYSLKAGKDATIDQQSGELRFTDGARACEVTVQVDLRGADGKISLTKEILVKYSPRGARDKDVTLPAESGTHLLLFMSEASTDKGKINFTKPAGATVECTADNGVVEVTEQDNAWTIVPQKGGFDTVTVTVTGGNADAIYTINVYVNRAVTANNFNVTLRDTTFAENVYGTTSASVPFEVTVNCDEGAMAGKQIYVKYGGEIKATGAEGQDSFSGSIDFSKESGDLPVEFGVQYAQKTEPYKPESTDGVALSSVTRTLARNAESIAVTYGGVQTVKIVTKEATVNFGETAEAKITIAPATHTDKLAYVYEGDTDIATFVGNKLTFRRAGTVTVKVQTVRGSTPTLTKQITVTHEPLGGNREVTLNSESQNLVLPLDAADQKHALIYFTEKEETEVSYTVEGDNGIVALEQKNGDGRNTGVYHIIPQKGGLATVKVTVHGTEEKTYTVNVYVNAPVAAQDIGVTFQNAALSGSVYGTTQTAIPFEVTVNCDEGAMAGKQIYVKYGGEIKATGTAGQTTFSGSIDFSKESGALSVEFGVQYAADMEAYRLTGTIVSTSRTLERNAEQIAVTYGGVQTVKIVTPSDTLTFSEGQSGATFAVVTVSPATHTDTLSYALEESESGTATLSKGKLTFSKPGTVTVKVLLERNGEVTLQKEVTVTYEPVGKNEKAEIESDRTESLNVLLPMDGEGKEGVIYFTEPEGSTVQYEVTKGADTVVRVENRDGVWHIIPISGGFATVKITVSPIAAARAIERKEYIVETYVDLPVNAGDFAVMFNDRPCADKFRTSLNSVSYSVTVTDDNGSTKGKKLYVSAGDVKNEANEGVLFLTGELALTRDSLPITFGVEYSEEAAAFGAKDGLASVIKTVSTSRGRLDEPPTVTYQDKTLQSGADNAVEFPNIGDEIAFKVKKAFSPTDFDLSKNLPSIDRTEYVKTIVSSDGETITLQALKPCTGQKMSLAIGGKTFFLSVTVHAKADQISVTCDGKPLDGSQKYDTLLRAFTFHVTIGRTDGLAVDNKEIEYSLDGDIWQKADEMGNVTADVTALTDNLLRFRSADRGANCEIRIEKVALEDFGLKFSVRNAEGADAVFGEVQTVLGAEELSFAIPTDMQGFVTVKVLPKRTDLLGGFGTTAEEFRSVISIDLNGAENWTAEYVASAGQIVIDHVDGEFRNTIKIQCGEKTVNVELSRINLAWVEFIGFDSKNTANGGDVYKGYQQVRVFAKQSVYGGKDVDYFRMPVQALNKMAEEPTEADKVALSKLVWKFTSHNDAKNTTSDVTVQSGKTVKYLGTEYKVADLGGGAYGLQTADGVTIVGADGKYVASQPRVTWVDAFSEADKGYVRIYFGDYRGLSEVDVQNDYFGNFGERQNWTKAEEHANNYDKSGRNFEASEGAFSYLRLEGGDGAASSKANAHFNFNVLEGSDLYNIFDATGYYAKNKIVLHNNLYGGKNTAITGITGSGSTPSPDKDCNKDELTDALYEDAKAKDLILDKQVTESDGTNNSFYANKAIIYGNGYQINLNALNTMIIHSAKILNNNGKPENTGNHSVFTNIYNVNLKGRNDTDTVAATRMGVYFGITNAYYSTVQNYGKLFSGNLYAKNTVFRNVAMAAIELWGSAACKDYLENVVVVNAMRAIICETMFSNHVLNIKGSLDVLNYHSASGLKNLVDQSYAAYIAQLLPSLEPYAEWFGKQKPELTASSTDMFVNPAIISTLCAPVVNVWDEAQGTYVSLGTSTESIPLKKAAEMSGMGITMFTAYTYNYENSIEAGSDGSRDIGKMFTTERDIRLLCEYLDIGNDGNPIQNTDHILWHMQRVYRDMSLVNKGCDPDNPELGREENHIEALKQSLQAAKARNDWDGEWPDSTTLEQALTASPEAAAMTKLLSETIVPSKRAY